MTFKTVIYLINPNVGFFDLNDTIESVSLP